MLDGEQSISLASPVWLIFRFARTCLNDDLMLILVCIFIALLVKDEAILY